VEAPSSVRLSQKKYAVYGKKLSQIIAGATVVQSDAIQRKTLKTSKYSVERQDFRAGASLRTYPAKALCRLNFNNLPSAL
jgi:hypothetical protein